MRRLLVLSFAALAGLLAAGCQSSDANSDRGTTWGNPYPQSTDTSGTASSSGSTAFNQATPTTQPTR